MVEPVSLAALGGLALTEGIKFLYSQAGEILRRRRERKDAKAGDQTAAATPLPMPPQDALEGQLEPVVEDADAVEELADQLSQLRKELSEYAAGNEEPDPADPGVLATVQALRLALESIIGQRITFKDEPREPSGTPVVTGRMTAKTVEGIATGIDTDTVEGRMHGEAVAERVTPTGKVAGVRIRKRDP